MRPTEYIDSSPIANRNLDNILLHIVFEATDGDARLSSDTPLSGATPHEPTIGKSLPDSVTIPISGTSGKSFEDLPFRKAVKDPLKRTDEAAKKITAGEPDE